jgi:hypothetical protein
MAIAANHYIWTVSHAQIGFKFLNFALEHSCKMFVCLPIKGLLLDSAPTSTELSLVKNASMFLVALVSQTSSNELIPQSIKCWNTETIWSKGSEGSTFLDYLITLVAA